MKSKICAVLSSVFLLLLSSHLVVAQESDSKSRTWTSNDGNHTIEATLLDYDGATKTVSLVRDDSTPLEVELDQLSSADKRYITRELRHRNAASRVNSPNSSANPFAAASEPQKTRSNKVRRTGKTLYGINWYPDNEAALSVALAKDTARDDKPVLWFRVLGDLEGFM